MTTGTSRALAAVIVAVLVVGAIYYYSRSDETYLSVTSFAECRDAGYPVMESFPEQCQTPDGRRFVNDVATSTPVIPVTIDRVRGVNITSNQIITSPLTITGEAAGLYFEGSFPIEIVDGNGTRLYIGPAQAQKDWMTSEFVPFVAAATFATPKTATGTIIIRNDNPSGLPENEYTFRIPVRFSNTERTVKLYYYDARLDKDVNGNILCSAQGLVPVDRTIPVTQTPLQDTIKLLLKGERTSLEQSAGITTEFPLTNVSLISANLSSSGLATLTLSDPNQKTSGGACRVSVLRAAVVATALQFPTVKSVIVSPNTLFQP